MVNYAFLVKSNALNIAQDYNLEFIGLMLEKTISYCLK